MAPILRAGRFLVRNYVLINGRPLGAPGLPGGRAHVRRPKQVGGGGALLSAPPAARPGWARPPDVARWRLIKSNLIKSRALSVALSLALVEIN